MTKELAMFGNLMLDNAPDGQGQFHAVFEPPEPCTVTGPDGLVGEVLRVLIDIKTQGQHSPLAVRSAVHNGEVTTLAEAQMLGGVFRCGSRVRGRPVFNDIDTYAGTPPMTQRPLLSSSFDRKRVEWQVDAAGRLRDDKKLALT